MSIRISPFKLPTQGIAGLALVGAVSRSDHQDFNTVISGLRQEGRTAFILDLSQLSSISNSLASAIVDLKISLDDRAGSLEVFGANVVVRWFLMQRLVEGKLVMHDTLQDALRTIGSENAEPAPEGDDSGILSSGIEAPEESIQATPMVRRGTRPDRFSHATLQTLLAEAGDLPTMIDGVEKILRRCGLATGCCLVHREGDALVVVGNPDFRLQATGWLGSLLSGAGCPMSREELGDDGFEDSERAFLEWSVADLHIPLINNQDLVGILSLSTGRPDGLWSYRSSELFAFTLLAERLCRKIALIVQDDERGDELQAELSPDEITFLLDAPDLQSL